MMQITAKLIEKSGFEALYMSGAGVSMSTLGIPDVGLTTLSEMLTRVSQISQAVSIPLIADGDTGYGNPLNVYRTVRDYERAGAAVIGSPRQTGAARDDARAPAAARAVHDRQCRRRRLAHRMARPFLLGTLLGMAPGIVVIATFVGSTVAVVNDPSPRTSAVLGAVSAVPCAPLWSMQR